MWALTLCVGMYAGMCSQILTGEYKTQEKCVKEAQTKAVGWKYNSSVCVFKEPKKLKNNNEVKNGS